MIRLDLRRPFAVAFVAAFALFPSVSLAQTTAPPKPKHTEAARLLALLIADTDDPILGDAVEADVLDIEKRLKKGFTDPAFPKCAGRLAITKLTKEQVSPKQILDAVAALKATPQDAVLVYYSGHGGVAEQGHYLKVSHADPNTDETAGKRLYRSQLIGALKQASPPRLVVLVTDSCSVVKLPTERVMYTSELRAVGASWDVMRSLFLQHRGLVDINSSSPGQVSLAKVGKGSVFTEAFGKLICSPSARFNPKEAPFVHWYEFYPILAKETETAYQKLKGVASSAQPQQSTDPARVRVEKAALEEGRLVGKAELADQSKNHQTIWTTSLMPFLRFGVRGKAADGGLKIEEVVPGTPAAASSLLVGDIIVSVNDKPTTTDSQFTSAMSQAVKSAAIRYKRNGQDSKVDVPLVKE